MTGLEPAVIAAIVSGTAAVGSGVYGAVSASQAGNSPDNLPTPVTRNDEAIEMSKRNRTAARAKAIGLGETPMSLTTPLSKPGGTQRPTLVGQVQGG